MELYKKKFIEFCIENKILLFGNFTLKSNRQSPYFFNTGLFNSGSSLSRMGEFYAKVLQENELEYDMLFGPAYKGIPLVCSLAITLHQQFNKDIPYCFNRKVVKEYGEKGNLVGAKLEGKVLIVDDVITAGTAIQESLALINRSSSATVVGIVVAIDRQEPGQNGEEELSATQEIEKRYAIPVLSVITLNDLIEYVSEDLSLAPYVQQMKQYSRPFSKLIF